MRKDSQNQDEQSEELELVSDDATWRKMAAAQLLLLAAVVIWALADRKLGIMLFSLIPLVFSLIYAAWTLGSAKRLRFSPSSVFFEMLSGKKGEIHKGSVEKVEVRRSPAMTSVTVYYRRRQGRGRLRLNKGGDAGGGVPQELGRMGYSVAGD